jgi:hypothetical protein
LPSPYQYPWVNFGLEMTPNIDSTPTLVFGKPNNSIVDTIVLCNTTEQDIFIDIKILGERDDVPITVYRVNNYLIPKLGSAQILGESMILQAGDLLYANSDFADNTFDCMISYRQLLEE